jgi:hypothetical protein
MTIWVRREQNRPSAEMWHLFESMTPGDVRPCACGITFAATDVLERLVLANPNESDRCLRCQMAYRRELRGGQFVAAR